MNTLNTCPLPMTYRPLSYCCFTLELLVGTPYGDWGLDNEIMDVRAPVGKEDPVVSGDDRYGSSFFNTRRFHITQFTELMMFRAPVLHLPSEIHNERAPRSHSRLGFAPSTHTSTTTKGSGRCIAQCEYISERL